MLYRAPTLALCPASRKLLFLRADVDEKTAWTLATTTTEVAGRL